MTRPGFSWQPERYLQFDAERTRPAGDLLARVPLDAPSRVADLGCGPGNSTALLHARWPAADILGLDSSAAMVERARASGIQASWLQADLALWRPEPAFDLLYSNATLQWLPDHGTLFPRLLAGVAPGGCLALQMPKNFTAPSHRLLAETAADGPWAARLAGVLRANPVAEPEVYYDLLAGESARLDIWLTTYIHVLEGDDPVYDWMSGTALLPVLDKLAPAELPAFKDALCARLGAAYPRRPDGRTLFPFHRLFIVALKAP